LIRVLISFSAVLPLMYFRLKIIICLKKPLAP
jgi:hypothetical protein